MGADYQEPLFKAIEAASELARELGHPPRLGDARLDDVLEPLLPPMKVREGIVVSYAKGGPDPLKLEHDYKDFAARVVIADLLYRPAQFRVQDALHPPSYHDDEDDAEPEEVDLADYYGPLREYLAALPPHDVQSEAELLWEVQAAGITGHLTRLSSVCDQLLARHPSWTNRATAVRAVFISVELIEWSSAQPWVWIGEWDTDLGLGPLNADLLGMIAVDRVADRLDSALAPQALEKSFRSQDELTAMMKLVARTAELRFEGRLDGALRLIGAWCEYQLGIELKEPQRCLNAAKEFEAGADEFRVNRFNKSDRLNEAVAVSYLAAGRSDLVETILRGICDKEPSADHFFRLARCCHLQGKEAETLEAFERFVQLRGDATPREQFQTTLALQFALETNMLRQRTALLGSLAMSALIKEQGEQLVAWFDPFYDRLSESARNKWWTALFGLSSPSYLNHVGDEVWNQVAAGFGEAVNIEFKSRVFRAFLVTIPDLVKKATVPGYKPEDERAVLIGSGTLGQHVDTLLQSRYPVRLVATKLDQWLKANHNPLWQYLRDSRTAQKLKELNKVRSRGAHDQVTRDEAARIFGLAREVLQVLVQGDSSRST